MGHNFDFVVAAVVVPLGRTYEAVAVAYFAQSKTDKYRKSK